jgi:hypothetical protein
MSTNGIMEAIRLLGAYTAGRFDIWMLSGSQKASCRAHLMSTLLGVKTPQSKSGVTALREAFYRAGNITGDCLAAKEENFLKWVREEMETL